MMHKDLSAKGAAMAYNVEQEPRRRFYCSCGGPRRETFVEDGEAFGRPTQTTKCGSCGLPLLTKLAVLELKASFAGYAAAMVAHEPLPPYLCRTPREGMAARAVVRAPTFHIDQETRGLVQDGYLDVRNPDPDEPIDGEVFILATWQNGEWVVAVAGVN